MDSEILRRTVLGVVLSSIVFAQCAASGEGGGEHWRYFGIYGVSNWSIVSETCDAKTHSRQSPINIAINKTLHDTLMPIRLVIQRASDPNQDTLNIVNNGHTVNFNYDHSVARISGGNLTGIFRVAGAHFHWGNNDTEGSEHTIDSTRFPIELHIVTFDESRYNGVLNASEGANSIAVVSVLFQVSAYDNPVLNPVIEQLQNVRYAGTPITMPYFDISTLLPQDTTKYFRYLGSLTTPPCSESVIWSVFQTTKTISSYQLRQFREIHELVEPNGEIDYLIDNWRPPQPLYDRVVRRSYQLGSSTDVSATFKITALMLVIAAVFQRK